MDKVIKFPVTANNQNLKNSKEDKKMNNIIKFSNFAKKKVLSGCSALLMLLATSFASAPCIGHFYEPEVPDKLQGR